MSGSTLAVVVRHLRAKLACQEQSKESDEQLLHAFLASRDDSAFTVLVRRYGPTVLHLCRRMLGHEQDAEDAFQATFLVLVQNAARLRNKTALASFLHGTAYRIALKAKQTAARRRKHEGQAPARPPHDPTDELSWHEVQTLVDEEVACLPEKYRSVFLLCCLEGVGQKEAAQRLGLKEGTLSSRLTTARKILSQRLARRGVELTAVLTASALAVLSAELMANTIEAALAIVTGEKWAGMVSASVAELVKDATAARIASTAKMAMLLLVTATVLGGAGAWTCRTLTMPQASQPQPEVPASIDRSAQESNAETPRQARGESVTVRGRVLGPDDKPVKGARLYWPRVPKTELESEDDIEIPQRAASDVEGRFCLELPRSDIKPDWNLSLVAAADSCGVAWVNWSTIESGDELTLRLVKDHPIEGRIINTEGKPQAGMRVSIGELGANPKGKLDLFLDAWQRDWQWAQHRTLERMYLPLDKILNITTTAKDGSFRITGAGAERLVVLRLRGKGSGQEELHVINRAGFDAAAVNKGVLERIPAELRIPGQPTLLYGPKLTYVRPPSRRIEGAVRESGSGKPIAGYRVSIIVGPGNGCECVSDQQGRYKLDDVHKVKEYLLNAEPPANTSWLRTGARIADTQGVQPMKVDLTVSRGILIFGRLIDKTTGKGVPGSVRFAPLAGNKFSDKPGYDSYKYERFSNSVDGEGRFKLAIIPGPGVLMVQASGPYKPAELDANERERLKITENEGGSYFTAANNSIESLSHNVAVKYVDFAPDAGTVPCEIFLRCGRTMRVKIEDADGRPVTGATVAGVTAAGGPIAIKDAACIVSALDSKSPRRLIFYHTERNMAGSLTVSGTEKEPPVARLVPMGCVTGRLLDRDGQPIAGADIDVSSPDRTASDLYRELHRLQRLIRTDKDGRFRIEGIVPDIKFTLSIYHGRTFLVGEPRIGARQVKAGEALDLGAVRVKPAQ